VIGAGLVALPAIAWLLHAGPVSRITGQPRGWIDVLGVAALGPIAEETLFRGAVGRRHRPRERHGGSWRLVRRDTSVVAFARRADHRPHARQLHRALLADQLTVMKRTSVAKRVIALH
jgi:hypothetical protein